ncbi:dynamin family protein [Sulfurospirillum sp. 1612]|uniref:dynamin family protein n=1 Tax=Sulfurospirillum sp. 1612 TaxID=3094835 RepID=UPI002F926CDB
MSIFNQFITTYKTEFLSEKPVFDASLLGLLKKVSYLLLDDTLSPSVQMKQALDKLKIRVKEPMKVAITGQFSSGKSTFLNALLAKSVLPTGITPVTSKVNYIRYGEELRIRVKYKDGRDEYHDIDSIHRFTDQRIGVEDIDYLILYSPLNMLKDIVFVDTPGLNSGANADTQTTIKVLKEVDGIIWLTLIDNAGKMSEAAILEQYLSKYKNKSLCVLNQKDKFSPQEVAQSVAYVQETFQQFFSQVVPISAKQALASRSHDKNALMEEALEEFLASIDTKLHENMQASSLEFLEDAYRRYEEKLSGIRAMDLRENIKLSQESNIQNVIDFIKNEIQPKAIESKEFAIKKELKNICQKVTQQYELFLDIYDELIAKIEQFDAEIKVEFSKAKNIFAQELLKAYREIEQIIETIAGEIYAHVEEQTRVRFAKEKKGFLKQEEYYKKIEYKYKKINADSAYKTLFYDDDLVGKKFKRYVRDIVAIEEKVNKRNQEVYQDFEEQIFRWHSSYSIIRKKEEVHSDIEFANMRKFAARVYEHILKPYHDEVLDSASHVSSNFTHIRSAIKFNYQNATEACISFLNNKIESFALLYESNPTRFSLYNPNLDEIKQKLSESFYMYELKNLMSSNRTFLSQEYERLSHRFEEIKNQKIDFINSRKNRHEKIIERLNQCREEL